MVIAPRSASDGIFEDICESKGQTGKCLARGHGRQTERSEVQLHHDQQPSTPHLAQCNSIKK